MTRSTDIRPEDAVIRLEGVSKSFGEVRALAGISFEVPDAQITGLLGPNGAGKTTALRVVYGVLRPDAGHAFMNQHEAADVPRVMTLLSPILGQGYRPEETADARRGLVYRQRWSESN
jgi:ABC-type multidrug transport system ATPase subunit